MTAPACRSCRAEIRWVQNGSKRMPLDIEPDPERGNVVVHSSTHITVYKDNAAARAAGVSPGDLHLSHFASCPQGNEWRK